MAQRDFIRANAPLLVAAAFVLFVSQAAALLLVRSLPLRFGNDAIRAVFLTNGQVYFGAIATETPESVTIRNVYYLKLSKPVLSQDDLQANADPSLVKLGGELHGPEDRMEISRAQILYIEKLKPDSRVVKAIQSYASGSGGQKTGN